MNISKIMAFITATAVVASAFSGCGQNSDSASDPSDAATENTSQTEVTDMPEYTAKYALSNENADEVTQRVYDLICDNYGTYMFSCQQESTWMGSPDYEMNYILETTGRLPAMRGLDFMNSDFDGVVQRSKAWWDKGGLVTICWHTGINGYGYQESKDDMPDFDKLLTEGTPEHEAMIANWDKAAVALAELRDAGVPVLWRPFHEFDGRWFWWGKGGSENFVKLWQLMYDRYTNHWGLNNLIWVLPYSGNGRAYGNWYPGDAYCDILGADSYDGGVQNRLYKQLSGLTDEPKPYCFHECGTAPTAEELQTTPWIWFMIWHTDHVTSGNDPEALSTLYNSDYVLTRDEIPSFAE